jgi:hypothetical protein
LRIFRVGLTADGSPNQLLAPVGARPAVDALDDALNQITVRYGIDTSRFVAMHLEYTRQAGL